MQVHFMDSNFYDFVVSKCQESKIQEFYTDTCEFWLWAETLLFRKIGGDWKLCKVAQELPFAVQLDEEQKILDSLERQGDLCEECIYPTCLTCPKIQ